MPGRVAPNRFGCHAQGTGSCLLLPLLEHLQEQKPDQHWKALHGPTPEVMVPLAHKPGENGLCDFTKVKRVEISLRGAPFPHLLAPCGGVPKALRTVRQHNDRRKP